MDTLVSLNVGMPKDVPWGTRTVHTGAWKSAVSGPRMVRRLNVDGDGQGDLGGHGGEHRAVLVYQTQSYRYWEDALDRPTLPLGAFGENFTVDGMSDDDVCIGDRYRIGGAVFEVSQPRVTCYRVGLRLDEPRMAALLVERRRPGFYLRVVTEGEVEAGQTIEKVHEDPERVSVAEVDALLYLPGHPREALARAMRVPALSPGWQGSLRSIADQPATATGNTGLTAAATSPPPAWPGFRPLMVSRIEGQSNTVFSVELAAEDGSDLPPWRPGQSLAVRVHPPDGTSAIRNYSLCNRPGERTYRIGVKEESHGAVSSYLRATLAVGDAIEVAAPRGNFFLDDGDGPVVLLSAGIGVTPVLSMLHSLAGSSSTRQVWWLHGARNGAEHPFAEEARRLVDELPGGRSFIAYSRPGPTDRLGTDFAIAGRLSEEVLVRADIPADADVYVCGPDAFMAAVDALLVGAGIDPARIHREQFGPAAALTPGIAATPTVSPHQPSGPVGPGPGVSFARSGLDAPWGPQYPSLLDFAEACDVPTRWSCRTGVCHNCETPMLAGAVVYDPEPIERPAEGNVLLCCSQPVEAVVLDA
ncbi:MOSC and FAD-binding oxidoreductase domain-containing protein [Mycolicibacterium sediminis]|uniref:Sulfurase n=1 Tax=Mycolicibacterium sediminis TaxID=1286180 RepID=A0A7I7QX78_9MYCO|nr:MOSC and FAD-binding oxidoreductase domain-containing protein [Mycolicibacterium sediminis]BBY30506.1 sulfurase [Mycolicibacterium sediminis]